MSHRSRFVALLAATASAIGLAVGAAAPATADIAPGAIAPTEVTGNSIPLTLSNNSGKGPVYIYNLGTNLDTGQMGWADAQGIFHAWPHTGEVPVSAPDASIATLAPGQTQTITMPKLSGRIYYSYGEKLDFKIVLDGRLVQPAVHTTGDPNRDKLLNWTEYTLNDDGLWINSTQVDFFSAPYQVGIKKQDGSIISTGRLKANAYDDFFNKLAAQPGWEGLIQRNSAGEIIRAHSPGHGLSSGMIDSSLIDGYIDQVWNHYRNQDITITPFEHEPQTQFFGRVSGDRWVFRDTTGAEVASFAKPSAGSVYGCAGELFAPNDHVVGPIARTLCSGFIRSTLLATSNLPADKSLYYQSGAVNQYAKLVHEAMANGRAYAFPFDDVGAHESLVHDGSPAQAYISLDPFTGAAAPIGDDSGTNEPDPDPGDSSLPAGTGPINASNYCLDVPWGDMTSGVQVQLANCYGNDAQTWTRNSDGTIHIADKCLDARSSGTTNGTVVQLWDCNGTDAQKWSYDSGSKAIKNAVSGLCLDASNGVTDGSPVHLWQCHGESNQQWTL
ncbi:beta-1,3-glucanase family protein [Microbacterium sp.]|uniref:beta-1,3-glucanase family protein n=1 Tax=Microbacterium sp. TaxID=51671 RepID=UPI0026292A9C|nr:beta-1,3-glucanase family protein [Microbacterium sp.]